MSDGGGEAPSRDEQGRTQTGRALVLVVVVALIAVLVLRHTGSSAAGPTRSIRAVGATTSSSSTTTTTVASQPTSPTTVAALIPPAATTVEVLNGLQAGPLASNLSGRLRLDGYKTLAPDNATTVTTTSAIYAVQSDYYPEASELAATLGLSAATIQIIRGLPAGAPVPTGAAAGSDLIVVIGTSLHSLASRSVTPTTVSTTTVAPSTTLPSSTSTTTSSKGTSTSSASTTTSHSTAARSATSTTSKSTSTTSP